MLSPRFRHPSLMIAFVASLAACAGGGTQLCRRRYRRRGHPSYVSSVTSATEFVLNAQPVQTNVRPNSAAVPPLTLRWD